MHGEKRDLPINDVSDEEIAEQKEPLREPSNNDYMAGSILANGIIWLWMQTLIIFKNYTSRLPPVYLVDLSYVTFIVAGFISSQQVAKRSERNQLIVSLRSALYSWIGSLIMMFTISGTPTISFAVILLICLMFGAFLGSYMLIRDRIVKRRNTIEESS